MSATQMEIVCADSRALVIRETNFSTQAHFWLDGLRARRTPVKPATLSAWKSIAKHVAASPILGNTLLANCDNETLRQFVDELVAKHLSPRRIRDILLVAKMILKSATDARGNLLYQWPLNHDHINAPAVSSTKAPCATRGQIEQAIQTCPQYAALIILLASSGPRLGEALALKIDDDGINSWWDPANSLLQIRRSVWQGALQAPKSRAAVRLVDLCDEANAAIARFVGDRKQGFLFEGRDGKPLSATAVYRFGLAKAKLPGAHSLRRFRATRLAEAEVPMPLIKFWLGHAPMREAGITGSYIRPSEMASRKIWAEKVGLGFTLPT